MKLGNIILILKRKSENGKETTYHLIESDGSYGKKSYSIMIIEGEEISYLENISCDMSYSKDMITRLYEADVAPIVLYDTLEEML